MRVRPVFRTRSLFAAGLLSCCLPASLTAGEPAEPAQEINAGAPGQASRIPVIGELNAVGLYPRLSSVYEGSGAAPGVAFWQPRIGGSGLDVYAAAARSFRGDGLLELRVGRVPHEVGDAPPSRDSLDRLGSFGQRWFAYASLRHRELSTERFFTASPTTGAAFGQGYRLEDTAFEAVGGFRLRPGLVASVRAGLLRLTPGTADADLFEQSVSSAMLTSSQREYFRLSAELALDRRDRPGDPRRGHYVGFSAASYASRNAEGSFRRLTVDARKYQPLGSERHVLAVRAFAAFDDAGSAGVPFYLQETLGGKRLLRGYSSFRFRGERVMALSAEYRFTVVPMVELAAFYDTGSAWGALAETASGLRSSYGLGVRLKRNDHVLLRVDAARGAEGIRARVAVGAAF